MSKFKLISDDDIGHSEEVVEHEDLPPFLSDMLAQSCVDEVTVVLDDGGRYHAERVDDDAIVGDILILGRREVNQPHRGNSTHPGLGGLF